MASKQKHTLLNNSFGFRLTNIFVGNNLEIALFASNLCCFLETLPHLVLLRLLAFPHEVEPVAGRDLVIKTKCSTISQT